MTDVVREFLGDDRRARIALALASQPGDPLTSYMVDKNGAAGTLRCASDFAEGVTDAGAQLNEWARELMTRFDPKLAREVLDELEHTDARILTPADPEWPSQLDGQNSVAPLAIWVAGNLSWLGAEAGRAAVAVLGSTSPSFAASLAATRLAAELTAEGYGVITGGTGGISGAAIEGAVAAHGVPLAVLPARSTRPWVDTDSAALTATSGAAIVAELAREDGESFAERESRDHLLLPLADAVVLVEAPFRDPNLETIRSAVLAGIGTGVVPSAAERPAGAGGAHLLNDGLAARVGGADDIHELLDRPGTPAWSASREARARVVRERFAR
ncbi:hypothetical protein EHW97_13885 [Aeromicrobium camelliae]|uniref:Smf/DprA SLOG domain-containing protein n=1 Tax=Aeromicrobium camelliae TaxID=1538144 RepID=A0A3N6W4E3_9ACTN|nr:DNA-processing protein DprA [Aeromicrobium camelliae]RQN02340.1 hypothetical protein EHW97_13885 [Aeromicrobium camelliae]